MRTNMNKQINPDTTQYVYEWVDPTKPPFTNNHGEFLMVKSHHDFNRVYDLERESQLKALANSRDKSIALKNTVFANEMIGLYELFYEVARNNENSFKDEFMASLPKSTRHYQENINFEEFESTGDLD